MRQVCDYEQYEGKSMSRLNQRQYYYGDHTMDAFPPKCAAGFVGNLLEPSAQTSPSCAAPCTVGHWCGEGSITPTPCAEGTTSPLGSSSSASCLRSHPWLAQALVLSSPSTPGCGSARWASWRSCWASQQAGSAAKSSQVHRSSAHEARPGGPELDQNSQTEQHMMCAAARHSLAEGAPAVSLTR